MSNRRTLLLLSFILLFATWIRLPYISADLPFFYNEDEAHHFNRVVEMVKKGDFNPHYFLKPSLHFYLRMPFVALGFLREVKRGNMRSIQEIRTRDQFGVAGYAFNASHPGIVKINRGFSLLLSLGLIILIFYIALELTGSASLALLSAFLTSISPELVLESCVIGVDLPMAFFVLLSTYLALRVQNNFSYAGLAALALCTGLATSSKYNALPVMLLPVLVCLTNKEKKPAALLIAFFLPWVGFFAASPYILSSLPLFLDQIAYEIWHYSIAKHIGHTAEPGLEQAHFYLSWLNKDGLGLFAGIMALIYLPIAIFSFPKRDKFYTVLAFPLFYMILMISQRTNFTRNMVVIVPYAALFAAMGMFYLLPNIKRILRLALLAVFIFPVIQRTLNYRKELLQVVDSRNDFYQWAQTSKLSDQAVSGSLQLPTSWLKNIQASVLDLSQENLSTIYLKGFNQITSELPSPVLDLDTENLVMLKKFNGQEAPQRIVENPALVTYAFNFKKLTKTNFADSLKQIALEQSAYQLPLVISNQTGESLTCSSNPEGYCWLNSRLVLLKISNLSELKDQYKSAKELKLSLELKTPWENQTVGIDQVVPEQVLVQNQWQKYEAVLKTEQIIENQGILLSLSQVHSPLDRGLNNDPRRLGLSLREISLKTIQ